MDKKMSTSELNTSAESMTSLVKEEPAVSTNSTDSLTTEKVKSTEKGTSSSVDTTPTSNKTKTGKSIATPTSIAKKLLADTESVQELKSLRAQVKGMEILLQQNAALEKEVERLCGELDEVTMGVQKKGYLYKWREREIYYAPKWGLRYFVLHGNKLSYFGDETERRPRRTINLSKCFVKEEGTKKDGQFHVLGIYLGEGVDDSMEETLLLKLSSENAAEVTLWIDMLEQACAMDDKEFTSSTSASDPVSPFSPKSNLGGQKRSVSFKNVSESSTVSGDNDPSSDKSSDVGSSKLSIEDVPPDDGWGNTAIDLDTPDADQAMSNNMMKRVKSSNMILQRSMSRQALSRKILSKRAPKNFTVSGTRLSNMADVKQDYTPTKKKAHLAKMIKAFPGYKPMHVTSAPSPLSGESRPGEYNFRGFFNLGIIILVLTHCDLIVNNLLKYGFKFSLLAMLKPPDAMITPEFENAALYRQTALALGTWVLSIMLNYSIEKVASKINISERYIFIVNFIVGTFNIIMPCYWVWTSKAHPTANLVYIFQSVIMWMKLISYAHANKDLRVANRKNKRLDRESSQNALHSGGYSSGEDVNSPVADNNAKPLSNDLLIGLSEVKDLQPPFLTYPQNITIKNLLYFLVIPTLCYQLNYPRTPKIRWNKVLFLLSRMFFVSIVVLFSVEQYIQPTLATSITPMRNGDTLGILERLLKLSIPNTYVWLLGFYFYFHCWLNLCAELTRFGDRMFYKDWWNAKTIDRYW